MNKQQLASKIWESANQMRSKIVANEYKDYILGFIFYKFLSDTEVRFLEENDFSEEDIKAVSAEDEETMEYIRQNIGYFIAYNDLFSTWLGKGSKFDVSDVTDALSAFSRHINGTHKKVFENIFRTLETGLSKLGDTSGARTKAISGLLQLIKDIPMDEKQDYDVLGFIYEYLIEKFAANAGKKAGEFMRNLNMMFKEMNTTVIVLAHTPKRPNSAPITENDLAGSRKLLNFFESAIAINKSIKGVNRRYIKQLKNRVRPIEYGADNVIEIELTDEGGWLHANVIGTSKESEHLRVWSQEGYEENSKKCAEMKAAGKSQNEIGKELGLSQATVSRMLKRQQKS